MLLLDNWIQAIENKDLLSTNDLTTIPLFQLNNKLAKYPLPVHKHVYTGERICANPKTTELEKQITDYINHSVEL